MGHRILAVCLDSGDTLVDEGTEIKDSSGVVQQAELIPGAAQMVRELKQLNYRLALVADGPVKSFQNILGQYDLFDLFDTFAISEAVGAEKPEPAMFHHALTQLDISRSDYGRVVMLGNNLSRDIKGANQLGIISVWLNWSPRRSKIPADRLEAPSYTITTPDSFIPLLQSIESSI
jgi:HAD superfamily hydrolase (TIGR01549 family)